MTINMNYREFKDIISNSSLDDLLKLAEEIYVKINDEVSYRGICKTLKFINENDTFKLRYRFSIDDNLMVITTTNYGTNEKIIITVKEI